MQRELILEKTSTNKLNSLKVKQQLRFIRQQAESNTSLGITAKWNGKPKQELSVGDDNLKNYKYTVRLVLTTISGNRAEEALDLAEKLVRKAVQLQAAGKWTVAGEASTVAAQAAASKPARPLFTVPSLTPEIINSPYFSDIIDRDAHLRIVHNATEMFLRSKKQVRSHTILYGEPGAAKTSMFLKLKEWYESDNSGVERVHMLDATTVSKAGLENWLLDKAEAQELPEILCLEEVEKFDMNVLLPLGSLMDGRGVITKLNARVNRTERAEMLVWMTCNNEDFVKKWHKGFLWSRCTHKIECVRPTREQMENKIMPRRVELINGDQRWVKPACDFAYNVLKIDDPREVLGLLDGGDRLLDGSYQADKLHVINSALERNKLITAVDRDEFE